MAGASSVYGTANNGAGSACGSVRSEALRAPWKSTALPVAGGGPAVSAAWRRLRGRWALKSPSCLPGAPAGGVWPRLWLKRISPLRWRSFAGARALVGGECLALAAVSPGKYASGNLPPDTRSGRPAGWVRVLNRGARRSPGGPLIISSSYWCSAAMPGFPICLLLREGRASALFLPATPVTGFDIPFRRHSSQPRKFPELAIARRKHFD